MLDRQEVRIWADHHQSFSAFVADLVHQTQDAFLVLARRQYDRPWLRERPISACSTKAVVKG